MRESATYEYIITVLTAMDSTKRNGPGFLSSQAQSTRQNSTKYLEHITMSL